MTGRIFTLAAILVLFGAVAIARQDLPGRSQENPLIMRMTDPQIMAMLADMELSYETDVIGVDNTTKYRIDLDGTVVNLYQYKDKDGIIDSLRLSAGYDMADGLEIEKANRFNRSNRFGSVHLDDEKDPFVVYDLDARGGVSHMAFQSIFDRFHTAVKSFEQSVDSQSIKEMP